MHIVALPESSKTNPSIENAIIEVLEKTGMFAVDAEKPRLMQRLDGVWSTASQDIGRMIVKQLQGKYSHNEIAKAAEKLLTGAQST